MVLDIGSRTHRALWHAGTLVREARVGRANVENVTPEDAGRIVDRAASELTALVLDVVAVTGSAGPVMFKGGMAVHQMELQDRLRALLDAEDVPDVVYLDRDPVTGVHFPLGECRGHRLRRDTTEACPLRVPRGQVMVTLRTSTA